MRRPAALAAALLAAAAAAAAATTTRVSVKDDDTEGYGGFQPVGQYASLSANGRLVAFSSWASLVPGDTDGYDEIYLRDRTKGTTTRVSIALDGTPPDGQSFDPSLSPKGRFLVFTSNATNLVPGDANGVNDVFLRDLKKGTLERLAPAIGDAEPDGFCYSPRVTDNGQFVVFSSLATNLVAGDTNGEEDVFLHDRKTGTTERISVSSSGAQAPDGGIDPSVSANGRWVVFSSLSSGLVDGVGAGTWHVYLRDRLLGTTVLLDRNMEGEPANRRSAEPIITPSGKFVVFSSQASDLVEGDGNGTLGWDVFLYDAKLRTIRCLSVQPDGALPPAGQSYAPAISSSGRFVAFQSGASTLVEGDTNGNHDIFLRDVKKGTTVRVSVDGAGGQVPGYSERPQVSSNGKVVVFESSATTLVPGDLNANTDLFARDLR